METNIQLLSAAHNALELIQAAEGTSRDATVRMVLEAHVDEQERCARGQQLTHISTVLRHPLRSRDSRQSYPARPLRLRLSPDLAERARATSLRLPGQPPRRGGRDYQARPLTDAVVTAIARREDILDPELADLVALLRHDAAQGLWRLAATATATSTERELFGSDPFATYDPVVEELLFRETAWHSPWRLDVLWKLAQRHLSGPNGAAAEEMMFHQRADYERIRLDLLHHSEFADDGLEDMPWLETNHEGRGGAAVWRARRTAAKAGLVDWLADERRDQPTYAMTPPGWKLRLPRGWIGRRTRAGSPEHRQLMEHRSALALPLGSQEIPDRAEILLWPLHRPGGGSPTPVPGVDAVIGSLGRMQPVDAAEVLLHDRRPVDVDDTDQADRHTEDDEVVAEGRFPILVPAYVARTHGLIDAATCANLLDEAETATRVAMARALAGLPARLATDPELQAALSCPAEFLGLLRLRLPTRTPVHVTRPLWSWDVESLADEVVRGSSRDLLAWLAEHLRGLHGQALLRSQRHAWQDALDRHRMSR